jgi:large subunit ribosomal protein L18
MAMDKKIARLRRARRTRAKMRELRVPRLTIFKTPRHIYAQIIDASGSTVVTCASTVDKEVKASLEGASGNIPAATAVGKTIAERAKAAGIERIAFDRAGFKYHGRVKALADAARENGLQF